VVEVIDEPILPWPAERSTMFHVSTSRPSRPRARSRPDLSRTSCRADAPGNEGFEAFEDRM
jgi:hypothetical protein